VVTGRWLIEGQPLLVLFDITSNQPRLKDARNQLFAKCGIGIPDTDNESLDAVLFGHLTAWFLVEVRKRLEEPGQPPVMMLTHFHEWLCGCGLLFIRIWAHDDIGTLFTTHATLLGRYLAAGDADLYGNLSHFNIDKEAGDRQIYHRYCIERAATNLAHVFTTVSDVTGLEAQHLLKRIPDMITPNGINLVKYTALHEFQNLHAQSKEKINQFLQGHFHGYLDSFDLDKTLIFFTAGRYEFHNKGGDLFIEALARLNHKLKEVKSDMTVIAFIIFPGATNSYNVETLRGQALAKQMRETVDEVQKAIGSRLRELCFSGKLPGPEQLLLTDDKMKLKRAVQANEQDPNKYRGFPPVCTHNVINDETDPVLSNIRRCRLYNTPHDRVKVIFHPEFLSRVSPVIPLDYEEFVRGCHLGVFPSYYEPWGYTPAECTALGVPNVSTNLSGFGCYMEHLLRYGSVDNTRAHGIYVINRRNCTIEDSVSELANIMFEFTRFSRRQRIILRNRTERISDLLDWRFLGRFYYEARDECLRRVFRDRYQTLFGERKRRSYQTAAPVTPSASRPQSPTPSDRESLHAVTSNTDMGATALKRHGSRTSSVGDEQELAETQSVASGPRNHKSPEELERDEALDRDLEERIELNMPIPDDADAPNGEGTNDANSSASDAH
jgi:glycogen(starch) synthase